MARLLDPREDVGMSQEQTLHIDVRYDAEDAIFIAQVRELDGCIAFGRTEAEMVEKVKAAIIDYLELFENAHVEFLGEPSRLTGSAADDVVQHSEVRVLAGAC
jgi:predicted RNase H-like HicB family nuclease